MFGFSTISKHDSRKSLKTKATLLRLLSRVTPVNPVKHKSFDTQSHTSTKDMKPLFGTSPFTFTSAQPEHDFQLHDEYRISQ